MKDASYDRSPLRGSRQTGEARRYPLGSSFTRAPRRHTCEGIPPSSEGRSSHAYRRWRLARCVHRMPVVESLGIEPGRGGSETLAAQEEAVAILEQRRQDYDAAKDAASGREKDEAQSRRELEAAIGALEGLEASQKALLDLIEALTAQVTPEPGSLLAFIRASDDPVWPHASKLIAEAVIHRTDLSPAMLDTRARIREELKTVRHRLMPYVGFFNLLREAQGSDPQLHAGDVVWLTEISEAVRNSSALERRLADMRELADNRVTDSGATVFRVQKMFKILEEAGYLQQTNEVSKGYTFTGKVDYLLQLIAFINENTPHISDDQVVDQIDPQARLEEAEAPEAGAA